MAGGYTPLAKWARSTMRIHNPYISESIAEFLGTFLICLFAVGATAQYILRPGQPFIQPVFGGVLSIMISVTVFGGASGAHINPAVTFGLAIAGEVSWYKVPFFWFSQLMGAYLGAGLSYGLYKHQLCIKNEFGEIIENDPCMLTMAIFSPLPSALSPIGTAMADQIVATAVLLIAVMGATDPRNMKVPRYLLGLFFALVVAAIAFSFDLNAGAVLNPARDLGPRLMALTIGHSFTNIFKQGDDHYWLVPLFGPMIGAALGVLIYIFFVGSHLNDEAPPPVNKPLNHPQEEWRQTQFIPKVGQRTPMSPLSPAVAANNPFQFPTTPLSPGINNNGYYRDDDRGPKPIY